LILNKTESKILLSILNVLDVAYEGGLNMVDMRSVFVVQIIVLLVCFLILASTWKQNRSRYKGLGCWAAMTGVSSVGYILLALRDYMPDLVSIVLANLLIVFAFVLFNRGVVLFYGLKRSIVPGIVIILIVIALQMYFTYFLPDIHARIIVISSAFIVIYGRSLWLIGFRTTIKQRHISHGIIWSVAGIILLNVYRVVIHIVLPTGKTDLFDQTWQDDLFLILQVPFFLFLVLNVVQLVSNSLLIEVQQQEAKFNSIFKFAPYAVIITNLDDTSVVEANDEMLKLPEYEPSELIGKTQLNLDTWLDPSMRAVLVDELKQGGIVNGRELSFRSKSGRIFPVLFSSTIVKSGEYEYIVSTMKDISDINRLKTELEQLASHDMLTGLPNRRKFDEICGIQLARAARSGEKLAMVLFDIDDFKKVNDEHGHDMGDRVLVAIADKLREYSRSADNVARHGGDEFTILLNGLSGRMEAEAALVRLQKFYESPILVDGKSFLIQLSMGVAMFPENGTTAEELLRKADKALYVAKRKGKNSIWFVSETE
jgi:diguanylate cyclase (GGDEF)-like protein/PAS domain S-box-containing protein